MIVRALFVVVAAFLTVVLPCAEAAAQTTTVTQGTIIGRRDDRDDGLDTKTINYADCAAGDALDVTYTVTGPNVAMEIWAGTSDCSVATARMTSANVPSLCWQIGSVAAAVTSNIPLKVWDILPHEATGAGSGTEDVCEELANGTGTISTGNGSLTIYFVPVEGNMNSGTGFSIPVKFDLQGPTPPSDLDTLLGDTRLYPTWTLDAAAANDSNGYNLYCEQASGSCISDTLTAGEIPPAEASVRGTTGASSTSGEASGLTNGVNYACGVAGIDKLSNVGKLSDLVCATPEPVNGYFKQYRAAGGTAGGGYCSFARRAATPAGVATSFAALALLFVRRYRRRTAR